MPMKVLSRKKWTDFSYFYTKTHWLSWKPREPRLSRPLHLAEGRICAALCALPHIHQSCRKPKED